MSHRWKPAQLSIPVPFEFLRLHCFYAFRVHFNCVSSVSRVESHFHFNECQITVALWLPDGRYEWTRRMARRMLRTTSWTIACWSSWPIYSGTVVFGSMNYSLRSLWSYHSKMSCRYAFLPEKFSFPYCLSFFVHWQWKLTEIIAMET